MTRRRYTAADIDVVPWPKPQPAAAGISTTWTLTLTRPVDQTDERLVLDRLLMHDPSLHLSAGRDGRDLWIRMDWATYDKDAVGRSIGAIHRAVEVLPVECVESVPLARWSVFGGHA